MGDQQRLQSLSEDFQKVQTSKYQLYRITFSAQTVFQSSFIIRSAQTDSSELQSIIDARQKLESQQQENKTVQDVRDLQLNRSHDPSMPFIYCPVGIVALVRRFRCVQIDRAGAAEAGQERGDYDGEAAAGVHRE